MTKRALISVSDKSGLDLLAKGLVQAGYTIYSTGGTRKALKNMGFESVEVSDLTGFPEILSGRLKTLHPKVFAGILARPDQAQDQAEMAQHDMDYFDLVVVNLYPFRDHLIENKPLPELIEQIDIGGPSLLRAAAKNHQYLTVVVDPLDYPQVIAELSQDEFSEQLRRALAAKVFRFTAAYDSLIADYLDSQIAEDQQLKTSKLITGAWQETQLLRYGENPQQQAEVYANLWPQPASIMTAVQIQGKALSFNNYTDADAAIAAMRSFSQPTIVALKHANPCGIASAESIDKAWDLAYAADPISIFGGIIAQNRPLEAEQAEKMIGIFLEIVIAPDFSQEALEIFKRKPNLRVLKLPEIGQSLGQTRRQWRFIDGGLLIQDYDEQAIESEELKVVTNAQPDPEDIPQYQFAMKACRLLKSNAIALTKGLQTIGLGPGQTNRVGAAKIALEMAGDKAQGAILASDAFFPFKDTVELALKYGIKGIIQPGGSIRDQESIDLCNQEGLVMIFTGTRHFKH